MWRFACMQTHIRLVEVETVFPFHETTKFEVDQPDTGLLMQPTYSTSTHISKNTLSLSAILHSRNAFGAMLPSKILMFELNLCIA